MAKHFLFILAFFYLFTSSLEAQNIPKPLLNALKEYVKEDVIRTGAYGGRGRNFPEFRYVLTDLNSDGNSDAIVLLRDKSWCGMAGCPMLIYKGENGGFTFISESGITRAPIRVLPEKNYGWKTLVVNVKQKGDVLLRFDGTEYPSDSYNGIKATQSQINSTQVLLDRN
ncbi:hypothetical protein [Phormidium tenue]|uniref:Uncharacterized protein n=1 Tax=Phormidium tenue FACHB-1050 TaxID=2692857 RepID=A0ABR8CA76_9CYAN|nr:hypothetical protein [Phormidium tenue]MBD2317075.1 hypothetical protein [Phormidium tenue FACHB-1050]